jgi:hypothetical protein
MIEITYNKDEDIIYVKRSGEIYLLDLVDYAIRIDEEFNELKNLYIIEDTRGSITKHNQKDDFYLIINEVKKRIHNYHKVKVAIIVDNPGDTALAFLYERLSKEVNNYYFKVFMTLKASKAWLKLR